MVISRTGALAILTVLAGTLTACGGSSGPAITSSTASTVAAQATTKTTAPPALASQPADAIVAADAAALRQVQSYHVSGTGKDADGTSSLSADVSADGAARMRLTHGARDAEIVAIGAQTYIKANAPFWKQSSGPQGDRLAKVLAGRWIKTPVSAGTSFQKNITRLLPKSLAYCTARAAGGVTKGAATTVDGQPVVVLKTSGKAPGTSPGELSVATTGPALPVRITQTGPRRPGGKIDPRCDDKDDTTTASDMRFSDFNKPLTIVAPPGALDLERLAQSSQTLS